MDRWSPRPQAPTPSPPLLRAAGSAAATPVGAFRYQNRYTFLFLTRSRSVCQESCEHSHISASVISRARPRPGGAWVLRGVGWRPTASSAGWTPQGVSRASGLGFPSLPQRSHDFTPTARGPFPSPVFAAPPGLFPSCNSSRWIVICISSSVGYFFPWTINALRAGTVSVLFRILP